MKSPEISNLSFPELVLNQPYPLFFKDVYQSEENNRRQLIRNTKYYFFQSPDSYRVFCEDIEMLTVHRTEYEFSLESNPKTLQWLLSKPQTINLSYATFWSEVIEMYQRFRKTVTKIKEEKAIFMKDKSYMCLHDEFVLSIDSNLIFLSKANLHQTSRQYTEKPINLPLDTFYKAFEKAVLDLFQPIP